MLSSLPRILILILDGKIILEFVQVLFKCLLVLLSVQNHIKLNTLDAGQCLPNSSFQQPVIINNIAILAIFIGAKYKPIALSFPIIKIAFALTKETFE